MFDAGSIIFNIKAAGASVFRQELDGADRSVKQLGATQKETAKTTDTLGKSQDATAKKSKQMSADVSQAYNSIGRSAVGVGASVVAMTALTVKAAIDWQSSWAGVTKTVTGTPKELLAVEKGLRALTGVLPASHTEIAAVAEAAGQLGIKTKSVVAFTKTMIDLGETTNLSANEAATSLARFMNVMGTSQDDVSNLGSAVVELGNSYATTEAEIVSMAQRLSGAARQVGLTEGETLGLAAALSSVGIEAEAGGSAVSKVMIDIAASVDKGGERLDKFSKISGVSSSEFVRQWKSDPGAALALFVKGLANAEAQGGSTLGMLEELGITEVRMRDALLRSAAASDQFTEAMNTGNVAFADNNALLSEAEKRYATTESQLLIMKNNIVDAAIGFGEVFLPAIVAVSQGLSEFSGFIAGLPEPVKAVVAVLGLGTGAVLLMGGTMLLAVPRIAEFRTAQALLATQMPKTTAAMRGTTAFLGGPWGFAVMAAITVLGLFASSNAAGQARVEELTSTLDQNTGAFTKNTRAAVAKRLQDEGVYDAAKKAGISIQEVTDAAMLGGDAYDKVAEKAAKWYGQLNLTERVMDGATGFDKLTDGTRILHDELGIAQDKLAETTEATEDSGDAASDASEGHDELAESVDGVVSSINDLAKELDELNGKNLDSREAARQLEAAYDDFDASLKENGRTLDTTTEKGRKNEAALDEIASAALDAGQAIIDSGGGYAEYQKSLETSRSAILRRINDLGITGSAAERLADKILKIPSRKDFAMYANTATAEARLLRIHNLMRGIGNTSTLHISTAPGRGGMTIADGAVIDFYANGGMRENHVAQIAAAGTYRVWAESETGGESYIPLAPSKRARSLEIWEETGRRLGVTGFADGGISAAGSAPVLTSSRGGDVNFENHFHERVSEDELARLFLWQVTTSGWRKNK